MKKYQLKFNNGKKSDSDIDLLNEDGRCILYFCRFRHVASTGMLRVEDGYGMKIRDDY